MDYTNVVRDFAQRTRRNLEFVRQAVARNQNGEIHGDPEVYEVTQLINSMLGLLVFPQQRYFDAIPATPLQELAAKGWPQIRVSPGFPDSVETLADLMRYLRNAVAHFNIEFLAPSGQIEGIRVWNTRKDKKTNTKKKTWCAELPLRDLEMIADRFVEMICERTECPGKKPTQPAQNH